MDTTYNVKIWKTSVYRGKRKSSYTVRWELEGREWRQPFATSALADSFRSELVSATSRGEAFSLTTGRPVSHQSGASAASWYEFSIRFADAQWRRTSGNNRKNVAKALMTTTIALLRAPVPTRFAPVDVRTAMREFAYNTRRRPEAPPDVAQILQWVERNSLSMAAWEDPRKVDEVLHALATKLDGTTAAASSVKRTHRILNVALEYAVTHKVLSANPLPKGRGTTPKTSSAVDKRALINLAHAAGLLGWIWHRPRGGQRLHAFFATMYYAGPRPEEVVAMRVLDAQLPDADAEDQWGELLFHTAQPEVGNRGLTPPESSPHILRSHPQKPCHSCTAPDHRSRAVRRLCREHCAWGGGRSSSHAPHAPLALLATDRPCFAALNCAERMIPFPIRIASS